MIIRKYIVTKLLVISIAKKMTRRKKQNAATSASDVNSVSNLLASALSLGLEVSPEIRAKEIL